MITMAISLKNLKSVIKYPKSNQFRMKNLILGFVFLVWKTIKLYLEAVI
jgi:hypothetical protein